MTLSAGKTLVTTLEKASQYTGQLRERIGASYPSTDRVTCVIWNENRGNFPSSPEVYYKGKNIRVTGTLYVYNGGLNIEVSSPSQIETY